MVDDMTKMDDMAVKRLLLAAVRTRFSPEIQKLKAEAIDRIVERILLTAERGKYSSAELVQRIFSETSGVHIAFNDIYSSLQRLVGQSRVEEAPKMVQGEKLKVKGIQREAYRLTETVHAEIEENERVAVRRFDGVVKRLFTDSERDSSLYGEPFLKFLSVVFFRLAGESVRSLLGEGGEEGVVYSPIFRSALVSVGKELGVLDATVFENGVTNFFESDDPEYAAIKWNLAQSYHSLRAIGLHEGGSVLGGELFKNAEFYLDTNVVISALTSEEARRTGFVALSKACKRLGIQMKVCRVTLEELKRAADHELDLLRKVIDQIPEETAVKVNLGLLEIYHKKIKQAEQLDLSEAFSIFYNAQEILRAQYQTPIEDDKWFDEESKAEKTVAFAEVIGKRYVDMTQRSKNENSCTHDSLCIRWIDGRREESGNYNIWFLTKDHTLPGCVPEGCSKKSLAIQLDAVLQWLAPMAIGNEDEVDLEVAYSRMLASRILPQERIYNLEDFLIFHQLNMTCKELPARDVEGCIQSIKKNAPLLNPAIPADREELAHVVSAYFADPSRQYKLDNIKHETELSELRGQLEEVRSDLAEEKKGSRKRGAWLRVSVVAIVLIVAESITIILALLFGAGENPVQKIAGAWPIITGVAVLCMVSGAFYVGKKRIKELGWPLTKIFRI
jgi:hypothetical protein